eukprot:1145148-Pelagomonas_calceolata.AAC.3
MSPSQNLTTVPPCPWEQTFENEKVVSQGTLWKPKARGGVLVCMKHAEKTMVVLQSKESAGKSVCAIGSQTELAKRVWHPGGTRAHFGLVTLTHMALVLEERGSKQTGLSCMASLCTPTCSMGNCMLGSVAHAPLPAYLLYQSSIQGPSHKRGLSCTLTRATR